jgi:hypothetical protein
VRRVNNYWPTKKVCLAITLWQQQLQSVSGGSVSSAVLPKDLDD